MWPCHTLGQKEVGKSVADRGAGGLVCRILGSGEIQTGFLGYSLSVSVFNLSHSNA